jgi:hypothetical protein
MPYYDYYYDQIKALKLRPIESSFRAWRMRQRSYGNSGNFGTYGNFSKSLLSCPVRLGQVNELIGNVGGAQRS